MKSWRVYRLSKFDAWIREADFDKREEAEAFLVQVGLSSGWKVWKIEEIYRLDLCHLPRQRAMTNQERRDADEFLMTKFEADADMGRMEHDERGDN